MYACLPMSVVFVTDVTQSCLSLMSPKDACHWCHVRRCCTCSNWGNLSLQRRNADASCRQHLGHLLNQFTGHLIHDPMLHTHTNRSPTLILIHLAFNWLHFTNLHDNWLPWQSSNYNTHTHMLRGGTHTEACMHTCAKWQEERKGKTVCVTYFLEV